MQLPKVNEAWYLIVFFTLSAAGLILAWMQEVNGKTHDDTVSTILGIVSQMNVVVVVAGASAYAGVEGYNMLAERYARREREIGRRQGRQEGRQEGRREGRQEILDRLSGLSGDELLAETQRIIDETRRAVSDNRRKD
jgi:hypothetical protein